MGPRPLQTLVHKQFARVPMGRLGQFDSWNGAALLGLPGGGFGKPDFFLEFAPAAALSKTGGFFNKIGFWGSLMGKTTQTRF